MFLCPFVLIRNGITGRKKTYYVTSDSYRSICTVLRFEKYGVKISNCRFLLVENQFASLTPNISGPSTLVRFVWGKAIHCYEL